ncbi:hypothetical protein ACMFMG_002210 [Clarireedia jacksonii]
MFYAGTETLIWQILWKIDASELRRDWHRCMLRNQIINGWLSCVAFWSILHRVTRVDKWIVSFTRKGASAQHQRQGEFWRQGIHSMEDICRHDPVAAHYVNGQYSSHLWTQSLFCTISRASFHSAVEDRKTNDESSSLACKPIKRTKNGYEVGSTHE